MTDGQKMYYKYLLKVCHGEREDLTSAIVHIWRDWGTMPNPERIAYNKLSTDARNEVLYEVSKLLKAERDAGITVITSLHFELGDQIQFNGIGMQVTHVKSQDDKQRIYTLHPVIKKVVSIE